MERKLNLFEVPKFCPKMYPENALAQKANGPGLPPPLTNKTFSRMRLSHTLFSNQKLRNFSKLEFFLLKGHKIFLTQNALGAKKILDYDAYEDLQKTGRFGKPNFPVLTGNKISYMIFFKNISDEKVLS